MVNSTVRCLEQICSNICIHIGQSQLVCCEALIDFHVIILFALWKLTRPGEREEEKDIGIGKATQLMLV